MAICSTQKPFFVLLLLLLPAATLATAMQEDYDRLIINSMMRLCRKSYHSITSLLAVNTRDMMPEEIYRHLRDLSKHRDYVNCSTRWKKFEDALGVFKSCISFQQQCKEIARSLRGPAPSPHDTRFF